MMIDYKYYYLFQILWGIKNYFTWLFTYCLFIVCNQRCEVLSQIYVYICIVCICSGETPENKNNIYQGK